MSGEQHRGIRTAPGWTATLAVAAVGALALGALGGSPAAHAATPPQPAPAGKPAPDPKPAPRPIDSRWGDDTTHQSTKANAKTGHWRAQDDLGSMYTLTRGYGIQRLWAHGITGSGVTVAVIDTGIAPVHGLNGTGKVVNGPDLSYDGQRAGTRYVDGYGHGTHMAGIIAGRDGGFDRLHPQPTSFDGVAPGASLLNMKVAAGDGGVDVTQVIAALDWVVSHRHAHGMNVRVVNLSYGTESVQAWQVDPLARAVENAWEHGIVVVTAAGNDGTSAPSLLMPAVDPHVLAVGAVDHQGTATHADDAVTGFTNGGSDERRPDLLAPGRSVVSLRVPGSYIAQRHPEGVVPGVASKRFFRGSGTSQATAVVSGEVALLLQARPDLTPDQVKALLKGTADRLVDHPSPVMGAGVVDVARAVHASVPDTPAPALAESTGLGSLDASRGSVQVVDPTTGTALEGEMDAHGAPWNAQRWVTASAAGRAWTGGTWNDRVWTGTGWHGDAWRSAVWDGSSWDGVLWSSHPWSAMQWTARSWRAGDWAARSWRDDTWLARSWRSLP